MLASVLSASARERRAPPLLSFPPFKADNARASRPRPPLSVARIALVKPDKARGVENVVLNMAQRGQLSEQARPAGSRALRVVRSGSAVSAQVSDAQLLKLLEQVNEQTAPKASTVR